jgi:hypothetical protein
LFALRQSNLGHGPTPDATPDEVIYS